MVNKVLRLLFCFLLVGCFRGSVIRAEEAQPLDSQTEAKILDFIQTGTTNALLVKNSEIIRRVVEQNNLQLFPAVVYNAINQTVTQLFNQAETRDFITNMARDNYNYAVESFKQNVDGQTLQIELKSRIEAAVNQLADKDIYHRIIEEMLRLAQAQQQKMIALTVAQQQMQLAEMEQRYKMAQAAIIQQMQQAIMEQLVNQQIQQAQINQQIEQAKAQQAQLQAANQQNQWQHR
ncbi:MAG: hypothetical protein HQL23_04045 [Candidatus Omnitrophica bacterium]|nr:hypothetical protein [Candidatus Omnitrophota bacterium]